MNRYIVFFIILVPLTIMHQSYTYDYAQLFFASARGISSTLATAAVLNCIARHFSHNGRWWIPTAFYMGGVLVWFMLGKIAVNETVVNNGETHEIIIGAPEIINKSEKRAYELSVLATIIAIVSSYYNTGGY